MELLELLLLPFELLDMIDRIWRIVRGAVRVVGRLTSGSAP